MTAPAVHTHEAIDRGLSGAPVELSTGRARLRMTTTDAMAADARGLVHGGFVFSMADHAAMLAIDHPNVVLGGADVKFLAPVTVGAEIEAVAQALPADGKKRPVRVEVRVLDGEGQDEPARAEKPTFVGDFVCFVPERHVLDR